MCRLFATFKGRKIWVQRFWKSLHFICSSMVYNGDSKTIDSRFSLVVKLGLILNLYLSRIIFLIFDSCFLETFLFSSLEARFFSNFFWILRFLLELILLDLCLFDISFGNSLILYFVGFCFSKHFVGCWWNVVGCWKNLYSSMDHFLPLMLGFWHQLSSFLTIYFYCSFYFDYCWSSFCFYYFSSSYKYLSFRWISYRFQHAWLFYGLLLFLFFWENIVDLTG